MRSLSQGNSSLIIGNKTEAAWFGDENVIWQWKLLVQLNMTTEIFPQLLINPSTFHFLVEKTRNGYCGKKSIKDSTEFSLKSEEEQKEDLSYMKEMMVFICPLHHTLDKAH